MRKTEYFVIRAIVLTTGIGLIGRMRLRLAEDAIAQGLKPLVMVEAPFQGF